MAEFLAPAEIDGRAYLAPAVAPESVADVPVRFDFPAAYPILAAVFEPPSDITKVTVSPKTVAMAGGGGQQFAVVVEGTNNPNLAVIWSATAGTISQAGSYNAPLATTQDQSIQVRATSVQDPTKWDEATVSIAALPTVENVVVTPANVELIGGASFQFSAVVIGSHEPSQAVTWSTTLGEIGSTGVLIAPDIIGDSLEGTITATSVFDPSKSGSVTFAVLPKVIEPDPVGEPASRFARPVRDISRGSWVASSGNDLYAMVDEADRGGSDFITSASSAPCELALGPVRDPKTSVNQVVRYEAHSPAGSGLTVELRQGANLIASWFHDILPPEPTMFEQTLTSAQCDSITNYGDLRIKLTAA